MVVDGVDLFGFGFVWVGLVGFGCVVVVRFCGVVLGLVGVLIVVL